MEFQKLNSLEKAELDQVVRRFCEEERGRHLNHLLYEGVRFGPAKKSQANKG